MFKKIAIVIAASALVACSSWAPFNPVKLSHINYERVADIGRRAVPTGDFIVWSWPAQVKDVVTLASPVEIRGNNGKHDFQLVVPPGRCSSEGADRSGARYLRCATNAPWVWNQTKSGPSVIAGVILELGQTQATRAYFSLPNEPNRHRYSASAPINHSVVTREVFPQEMPKIGFTQTLTYTGLVGNQLRLSYREFVDGMIRPGFTQEIAFDYVPGQEYGYKGARFVVHNANPIDIDLTVIKPFGG